MRLALKFTLALVGAMFAVLTLFGYVAAQRELDTIEKDRIGDHLTLGRSLSSVVGEVLRTSGVEDAKAPLTQASKNWAVLVRLVQLHAATPGPLAPQVDETSLVGVGEGDELATTRDVAGARRLYTYV